MFKRLSVVIVLLLAVSVAFAVLIVKELTKSPRAATPRPQPAASVGSTPAEPAAGGPKPVASVNYTTVVSRNLFSPTRTEAPVAPPVAATPPPPPPPVLPKPNLFGVVLQETTPIAYLEDPTTKRVARYRVGDSVAGGTVQAIGPDTVTLNRPEGQVIVRLHDPTRPKAAVPTQATPAPGPVPAPVPGPALVPPPGGTPAPQFRRPGPLGRIPPQPTNAPSP